MQCHLVVCELNLKKMKKIILSFIIFIAIVEVSIAQNLTPTSPLNFHESHQIQYFQIGDFVSITSDAEITEYSDFTETKIINVEVGKQYDLVLSKEENPFGSISGNTFGYSIWVDFNDDAIFSENELIYSKYDGSGVFTYEDTIEFTDSSLEGKYRLRVRNEWGIAPDSPTDVLWGGETEDYTINFTEKNSGNSEFNNSIKFYPNPTSTGMLTVSLNEIYDEVTTTVRNVYGGIVRTHKSKMTNKIDVQVGLSSGFYFVEISTSTGLFGIIKILKQ